MVKELSSSVLEQAVAEIEAAAYRRGADDAIRALKTALIEQVDLIAANLIFTKTTTKRGERRNVRVRDNSNASRVLQAITENPGLSGADLHRYLEHGEQPVNERTMRTALRRLRQRGLIEKQGDGWVRK